MTPEIQRIRRTPSLFPPTRAGGTQRGIQSGHITEPEAESGGFGGRSGSLRPGPEKRGRRDTTGGGGVAEWLWKLGGVWGEHSKTWKDTNIPRRSTVTPCEQRGCFFQGPDTTPRIHTSTESPKVQTNSQMLSKVGLQTVVCLVRLVC